MGRQLEAKVAAVLLEGVFGVFGHPEAANLTYLGLHALQHRGQEAAGIVSADGAQLRVRRAMGLVADAFDALCSHQDEVATLPQGASVLAGNGTSAIQAAEIDRGSRSFLGLQYHPEHTLATTAAIIAARMERMVAEGFARSLEDMQAVVADLRALDADPGRRDLAWRLGLDRHILDPQLRTAEFGNWLRAEVLPHAAGR